MKRKNHKGHQGTRRFLLENFTFSFLCALSAPLRLKFFHSPCNFAVFPGKKISMCLSCPQLEVYCHEIKNVLLSYVYTLHRNFYVLLCRYSQGLKKMFKYRLIRMRLSLEGGLTRWYILYRLTEVEVKSG
jgi:hypothetical protein